MFRSGDKFIINKMKALDVNNVLNGHSLFFNDKTLVPNNFAFDIACSKCRFAARYDRQANSLIILKNQKCIEESKYEI